MPQKKEARSAEEIADRDEVLAYLTSLLRDGEADEKTRLRATEQLGKYLGMNEKRIELGGKTAVTIIDDVG
ncbi:MAG: hypothetical protein NC084_03755 [Bacteroides sp.]|nr:hypothetical protein [Roseburia sp.]MCM1461814.1 hypothetical protein [Bacteroides sp.]